MASVHGREERAVHVSFSLRKFPNEVRIPIKVRTPDLGLVGDIYSRLKRYGKLRLYLTMFLCVLWDPSVFLSILGGSEDLPVYVPEGLVTYMYLRDKRTSDLDHADPETGLQQEEEPDFCRQDCVKEDGEE
ncbi:hypothetical protein Bbelb_197630 [Branchiostoma belcheri]|nr:hypothetical protein Bbelb_197630 [Branchiostoma belcheri]